MTFEIHGHAWDTPEQVVLLEQVGSHAHGTRIPPEGDGIDDIDLMGVVLPDRRYYLGLSEWGSRGTKESKPYPIDCVLYELRKFVSLLLQGNPNVMCMLWPPEGCVVWEHPVGAEIRTWRHLFVGKHVYRAFKGYAHAQMTKMFATEGVFAGYMGEKRKGLGTLFKMSMGIARFVKENLK